VLAGTVVLGVVVDRVGSGAFLTGLRATSMPAVAAALLLTAAATLACTWRWRTVAGRLGLELPLGRAIAAYYRSQLLNATLPGGVLGDADRAVRHGVDHEAVGRSVRAVVWERSAGPVVQVAVTVGVLLASPARGRLGGPVLVAGGVALVAGVLVLVARRTHLVAAVRADARAVLTGRTLPVLLLGSLAVLAAHLAVFVVAARAVGADASLARLVVVGLVVLTAAAVPASVAGWGPREGAAAAAFAAAGLPAAQGLAASVVYGVLALVAVLPGVVVMLSGARPSIAPADRPTGRPGVREVARA
jgi:uncharacterized membrane protein YbhN (UPF0104 family)